MDSQYYNSISNYYDADASDYDSRYWNNTVLQRIRQSFREETKRYSANSMLEIGCGTGLDLVHFAVTHPERKICGLDISTAMINLSRDRIKRSGCINIETQCGSEQNIKNLFPNQTFDIIYIYFGALNTSEDLSLAAKKLKEVLNPGGHIILSCVNKWYLGGMILELIRFRFSKVFSRLKPIWGGYSPTKYLASHCYTPREVTIAFKSLNLVKRKGYCIVHPAWYFTGINKRLGKIGRLLWRIDNFLDKTFFWQFGEYTLFVFEERNSLSNH
jgi:ubiquinone/menaquinone biosynthesis C-methylase UbiE